MITRERMPYRGGNWNNTSNAGLGALNFNNSRTNANSNIGFRPALDNARSTDLTGLCQCNFEKDAAASALAETLNKPVDASTGCTFSLIVSYENILNSAYQCRKGKANSPATLNFFNNLEENVINLYNELNWGTYELSNYHHFYVFEPKRRLISAPNFRDRVVHRAIFNVIEPLFDKTFIHHSYACRNNKGAHKGADVAQRQIQQIERKHGVAYALKADISKYFSSVDHEILKRLLSNKIKCEMTLTLLHYIIDASPSDSPGVGMSLGNLTSQIFANVYLHELDWYVKHTLKVKNYTRYMDDFVIIHQNKNYLHAQRIAIQNFLQHHLKLKTNSKTQVFPIAKKGGRALDFLGYRIYSTHRLLRKSSVKSIKGKLKKFHWQYANYQINLPKINQSIQSWLGHASHASSYNLRKKLLTPTFKRGDYV